jgi:hypothetical protein
MMQQAKDKGSKRIVIVNSHKQAAMKKGQSFMPAAERVRLIRALDCVDAGRCLCCPAWRPACHPRVTNPRAFAFVCVAVLQR